ncbi:MAG: hypothetical protein ABL998_20665 [Planctomycetota bacterium]
MKAVLALLLGVALGAGVSFWGLKGDHRGARAEEPASRHPQEGGPAQGSSVLEPPQVLRGSRNPIEETDSKAMEEPRVLGLRERLLDLRSAVQEPLSVDAIEAKMTAKYEGFEPGDLLAVYPMVRDSWKQGLHRTVREAIDSGQYVSEIVSAGTLVNTSQYAPPGETFHSIGTETQTLGNGLVEVKIVVFDRVGFPEQYARAYEEVWVHDRIDEAGICPYCK